MFEIEVTRQYLRDLKLARKRGLDESKLDEVIPALMEGLPVPPRNKDHALINDYKGCRECHITPDWLLIYSIDEQLNVLSLIRNGTHSDLF